MSTTIRQNVFLPTQISGCTLWLDGADTSSMILSGSTITTWKDKSSLSNNATSSTSPQYIATGGVAFGGTAYFGISSPYSYTCTVFMVASGVNNTVSGRYYWNYNQVNYGAVVYNANVNLGGPLGYYHNAAGGQVFATIVAGTLVSPFLVSLTENVAGNSALGYFNGTQAYSLTCATGPATTITEIGGSAVNGALSGNIYELIFFNSVLPSSQRQQVEGYLAQKWGLQTSLPPNHPYRYSAYFTNQAYISTNISPMITNRFTNASFNPANIAACLLWLDGADPAGTGVIPANGSTLTTWKDKSPTGNNMTVTSGTLTYTTNPYSVSFPDAQVTCTSALSTNVVTAGSSCIFIVVRDTYINPTTFGYAFTCVNINDYSLRFEDSPTNLRVSPTGDIGANYYVNGTLASPGGLYGNIITVPAGYNVIDGTFTVSGTTQFGLSQPNGGNRYFTGNIQEVILYSGPITTAQQQQVEGYLAWKWGLVVNLPPTHPYKNTSAVFVTQPSTLAALAANPYNNMTVYGRFNPKSISGIQLWLDAADPSTITGTSPVTAWRDKSGNGNNGTASGSPVLLANSLNGSYPSIYFNGSSSIAGATVVSGPTLTAFCILQTTDTNLSTNGRLLSLSTPGQNDYNTNLTICVFLQFNPTYICTSRAGGGTAGTILYDVPVGTSALVATTFAGNTSNTFYGNGSLFVNQTDPNWTTNFSITTYCIGTAINPSNAWYKGRIGEIILYSTALTNPQRQQVEGYLAWKWGLAVNLPPSHAYKLFPPPP